MSRPNIAWPGPARITLVALAVVPAAMAYPWQSTRDRWVLGVGIGVALLLLAWWRGLHLTSIVRRRAAMLMGRRGARSEPSTGTDVRATAVLRVTPPLDDVDVLPLPLIARYLNRYGIRADAVRVTSRDTASGGSAPQRETWVGLTLSAAGNLAALQARSSRIPLYETAEVAVRRLGDHLRESGWEVTGADAEDVPELFAPSARETWHAVWEGTTGYVAAYRLSPDAGLPDTLAAIWAHPARETWTAVEIAETAAGPTVAAACAFHTEAEPGGAPPLAGLTPQRGNQRAALRALHPLSVRRLDGHAPMPAGLLSQLQWRSAVMRVPTRARHAAV
ncbi:type VII secretion protein EccE [Mycobacterium sp. pUA109]|uniref:type VII secretion protein EccE n=1 Tax=Mycobacterium sp. pUA109 TaxID=3238982 RepID=UPI00351B40DD